MLESVAGFTVLHIEVLFLAESRSDLRSSDINFSLDGVCFAIVVVLFLAESRSGLRSSDIHFSLDGVCFAIVRYKEVVMRLKDLSQYIEIDIDEALEERFMDSEELYVRFLKKLEAANDLAVVENFVAEQNWPEALRKAHNLKGVCGSLGLTKLQGQLAALVKLLRSEDFTAEQVEGQLHDLRPEWERTLDCIHQLEA